MRVQMSYELKDLSRAISLGLWTYVQVNASSFERAAVERAAVEPAAVEHGRVGPRERARGERGEEADRGVDRGAARRSSDAAQHVGRGVGHASSDIEPPTIMACPCTVMVYE